MLSVPGLYLVYTYFPSCPYCRIHTCRLSSIIQCDHNAIRPLRVGFTTYTEASNLRAPPGYSCHSPRQFTPRRLAPEISAIHAAPQVAGVLCSFLLGIMLLYWCWFVFGTVQNGENSTARVAAVSPKDRAALDDVDDSLLVSSVFFPQNMFSGFAFVRNRHNDRCGLDSPTNHTGSKNSPVPNH